VKIAYLFVSEAQLVLENDAAIVQTLSLIGEGVEGICKALRELLGRRSHAEWCQAGRRPWFGEVDVRERFCGGADGR
jgi:hypothetical protein